MLTRAAARGCEVRELRVMAVDDEELALRRIDLALKSIAGARLVASAYSGEEASEKLADAKPDVILLDVEMANGDGTGFAKQLRGPAAPLVIFVTAYEDYAIEAFRLRAVDYVLKPVQFARLAEALQRARAELRRSAAERTAVALRRKLDALEATSSRGAQPQVDHIWVDQGGDLVRVALADVDWFEAERDYVRVHVGAQSYLMRGPLSDVEARLGRSAFLRVRRSALVRVAGIRALRLKAATDRRLVLASGCEVRVGKTYLAEVDQILDRA